MSMEDLWATDPEVARLIEAEKERQQNGLELIAAENFTSPAVLAAQGSVLTNKYAEGYPGRRYYGGCEYIDQIEVLAIQRAKELFGAEHANVQPYSGSLANMAVYVAALQPGDTLLGMDLSHGGHLTHGSPVGFSGKYFRALHYGVRRDTELIDLEQVRRLAQAHRPRLIIAGASAYPRQIDCAPFRQIADEVGAYLMVDMAHFAGLVAAGLHPDPVPYADFVTSTTHKTLRGPRSGFILCRSQYAKAIDAAVFPGLQGGPLEHAVAAKAVCFHEARTPAFRDYQAQIVRNARALAAELAERGFRLVSGGTDTHLMLIDLTPQGLTGKFAQEALDKVGVTANKNTIPFDTRSPVVTSGLRLGTPALTTRGMKEAEMGRIAAIIAAVLTHPEDEPTLAWARAQVQDLCHQFPLYQNRDGTGRLCEEAAQRL